MSDKKIRIGVIGIGNMGSSHCQQISPLDCCELTAVCDINPEAFRRIEKEMTDKVVSYTDPDEFMEKAPMDAVIIAVPHYDHVPLAIKALKRGLHIIVEKPVAPAIGMGEALLEEGKKHPDLVQCCMLPLRTYPGNKKIKELLDSGELGSLQRINWIVTAWFRTQCYYDSGDWRASWRGEGGGVLLNQCPHQLDLLQWFFGMPEKVYAIAGLGKYHQIEVEDDVTAVLEYSSGVTGVFVTTTGEAPGTNRLEIVGTRGKLIYENSSLHFLRNPVPMDQTIRESSEMSGYPPCWEINIPIPETDSRPIHQRIIENFIHVIQGKEKLLAPLTESVKELEIGNAMLMSGLSRQPVTLPIDRKAYGDMLDRLVATSHYVKKTVSAPVEPRLPDFSGN